MSGYEENSIEEGGKSRTPLIIGIVVVLALCLCCLLVIAAWFGGDFIMELFGLA